MAVIGVGYWGRNHVRVLYEVERAELKAVCDVNPERAKWISISYRVPYFISSKELLKDDSIEAVTICTWPTVLAKEAKKALEAGKHVLVEKPMATSSKEAQDLMKLAEKKDLILMVSFIERFNLSINYVRELIPLASCRSPSQPTDLEALEKIDLRKSSGELSELEALRR